MTERLTGRRPDRGLLLLFLESVRHSCWLLGLTVPRVPPQLIRQPGPADRRGGHRG